MEQISHAAASPGASSEVRWIERYFRIRDRGSSLRIEVLAGIV